MTPYERGIRSGQLWFLLFLAALILTFASMGLLFPILLIPIGFCIRALRLSGQRSVYAWIVVGFIPAWLLLGLTAAAYYWIAGHK